MQGVILFKKFFQNIKPNAKFIRLIVVRGENSLQKLNPTITVGYIKCKNKNKI